MTFTWKSPTEGVIDARKEVGGVMLVIRAEDVRRTATGLHAKVTIALAEHANATKAVPVEGDVFNVQRSDDRHDFSNRLYGTRAKLGKFSKDFIAAYPQPTFEADLFDFSEDFYRELLGNLKGGFVAGDESKTEPEFLMDGYVLNEGGTILYAPPKSAKSYTAMLWAVAIDAGVPFLGVPVKQARVMYGNLERGEQSMARRLGLVNRILGLDPKRPLLMLNRRGRTMADVYEPAKEMITEHGVELFFLDSLTRAGHGDLNGNEEANKSMDYLNRLIPAWVAIGHTPRADDSHIFGSVMFEAAMDIGVNVRRQRLADGTLGIGLNVKDTNDTGVPPLRILAYEFDRFGLRNVRDAHPGEFSEIEETVQSARTPADRILDQLGAFGEQTVTELAKDLAANPGTVHREVMRLLHAGKVRQTRKEGRSIFYGKASDREVE